MSSVEMNEKLDKLMSILAGNETAILEYCKNSI